MILQATHTHLYPGHRGTVSGITRPAELHTDADCVVEFSDGSVATARMTQSESDWLLDADAYRTAAGTAIAAKRWLVRLRRDGDRVEFRVVRRAPGD